MLQVATGMAHSLFLVESTPEVQPILSKLSVFVPSVVDEVHEEGGENVPPKGGRGRPKSTVKPAPKRAKK